MVLCLFFYYSIRRLGRSRSPLHTRANWGCWSHKHRRTLPSRPQNRLWKPAGSRVNTGVNTCLSAPWTATEALPTGQGLAKETNIRQQMAGWGWATRRADPVWRVCPLERCKPPPRPLLQSSTSPHPQQNSNSKRYLKLFSLGGDHGWRSYHLLPTW